jgi:hypothetical protein
MSEPFCVIRQPQASEQTKTMKLLGALTQNTTESKTNPSQTTQITTQHTDISVIKKLNKNINP